MATYEAALEQVMRDAEQSALTPMDISREQLESQIEAISADLRGPLSNSTRIILCGDRRELKIRLAAFDEAIKRAKP